MDKLFFYPNEILTDAMLLQAEQNKMLGLGYLARACIGLGPIASDLACAPTSPASLAVTVGVGSIYALENVDSSPYGSLGSDTTDTVVKQGINLSTLTLNCPAPTTAGQSIVYLIEGQYQDSDTNSSVNSYFNSANPAMPFSGPNNTGSAQYNTRKGLCAILVKAGVAATTGSQTAPSADTGYIGLYAVTVAYGATTITSGNISQISASFIGSNIPTLAAAIASLQGSMTVPIVSTFASSGSFTIPANCTAVEIELWGGGGGGGAGYASSYVGSGAGGAGYARGRFTVTPGATVTITVGTGGAGATGTGNGGNGGSSSFGSMISATGGGGGQSATSSGNATIVGTGGTGTGGYINVSGQVGSLGSAYFNGFGGAAFQGFPAGPNIGGSGVNGGSFGCGGSAGGVGGIGGSGANGIVIVRHLP